MKAVLVRTPNGLWGATPADQEAWAKFRRHIEVMKPGGYMRIEWSTPRNGPHHRKLMALLQLVAENSEVYNTVEKALVAVKVIAGFIEPHVDPRTGEILTVPQSIAFDAMEQERFEAFYSAAIDAVLQHILPQLDRHDADRLLELIVQGWG